MTQLSDLVEKEIPISILRHSSDRNVTPGTMSWEQLISLVSRETSDKKSMGLWSPVIWKSYAKIKNALRVSPLLVLDFDHCAWADVYAFVGRCPSRWFMHTTFRFLSFDDEEARCRIVLPLSRCVEIHEWARFWARAIDFLGLSGKIDAACRGLDRAFFVPCHRPGAVPEKASGGSGFLDVDAILLRPAPERNIALEEITPEGWLPVPRESIDALAKNLSRSKRGDRQALGHYLKLVCKGEPFADPGNRDNVLFRLACVLAEHFPTADPSSIAAHFAPSLQLMGDDAPSVETVREKITRKQREARESADDAAGEIETLNLEYAWIESLGRVAKLDESGVSFLRPETFRTTYSNRLVPVGDRHTGLGAYWLQHPRRRTYARLDFAPPPVEPADNCLNLWRGFAVEPVKGAW